VWWSFGISRSESEKQWVCQAAFSDPMVEYYAGDVEISNFNIIYSIGLIDEVNSTYSGDYEGEIVYPLSLSDDGNAPGISIIAEELSGSEVRIKLKIKIQHDFLLYFTPGSEKVSLVPKNGWGQWINGAHIPDNLQKEVPFMLSTTGNLRVKMRCEYSVGQTCGLQNSKNSERVPLNVMMTLPGLHDNNGREMNNTVLDTSEKGLDIAPPGQLIANRRSHLDFIVQRPTVEKMVKSPGSTWKGVVTLLFESEVD